ncbi:MAG: UDP-glucose 4-epimerase GalE [Caulobacteraceae bacterium]
MTAHLHGIDTVLITGGAGYIGSHTAWACLDAGLRVVVLDNLSTGARAAVPPKAIFVEGAVEDRDLVHELIRTYEIGAVLHLAASTIVEESMLDPYKYHRNNTLNSFRLMEAVANLGGMPFILSSTAAVYAPCPGGRLSESASVNPVSPYGLSKLRAEQLLAGTASVFGFPYLAMRYFNVAGADPLGRTGPSARSATHLLKVAVQAALGLRPTLPIHGRSHATPDGACVRDYIHVSDLAQAHVHALAHLARGGASGLVNCGTGRGASVLEVVAALEAELGRALPTVNAEPRLGDIAYVVADATKLRQLLPDWAPRYDDLRAIVSSALAWERRVLAHAAA